MAALVAAFVTVFSCGSAKQAASGKTGFPADKQKGKIAIVAHRGFWDCEAAGYTQNSIASLRCAQENHLWGSEFDVHVTSDDQVIVNHDNNIQGVLIWDNPLSTFKAMTLKNGEKPSTLDEYLTQGEKSSTMLVLELKKQKNNERADVLLEKSVEALKAHKLFTPSRVVFISFDKYLCDRLAAEYPQFVNQYLSGDIAPSKLASQGINGIDYEQKVFKLFPGYVEEAHNLGMSVNAWTVNKAETMKELFDLGINQVTTNDPLLARQLLGTKEYKPKK